MQKENELREHEEYKGVLMDIDSNYGIITDSKTVFTMHLIERASLLKEPFKVVTIVPVTGLKRHIIPDAPRDTLKYTIKIGEGLYNARYLGEICLILGTQNVGLHQAGKDDILGVKTENGMGVIAPIIVDDMDEKTIEQFIPSLDKVMDDFFSGKMPADTARFSLRNYAKKK